MSDGHPVLFIDNGGYALKALYIPDPRNVNGGPPRQAVVPNCVGAASFAGRGIVGDQLSKLPHFHGLMVRRPVDRGFIVDASLQSYIWEYLLQVFAISDESDVELFLTVPFAAPKQVVDVLHYLVARRFKFRAVTFVSSTFLALVAAASSTNIVPASSNSNDEVHYTALCGGCAMVVDFGFSATTIVPYVDFLPLKDAVVRVDVGGKLLSNRLKEIISFTQMNVAEDGWLVNHIMERCCRVEVEPLTILKSQQQRQKQRQQRRGSRRVPEVRYYLPTIPQLMPLGCREEDLAKCLEENRDDVGGMDSQSLQHISLRHEAFLIPELLFHPSGVGIQQMGVVESMLLATSTRGGMRHTPALHRALMHNIVAFGGTANFPNLRDRLKAEIQQTIGTKGTTPLQPLAPENLKLEHTTNSECEYPNLENSSKTNQSELQPLYGAFALLTSPKQSAQLDIVRQRSHVDLRSNSSTKQPQSRSQNQRAYEAILQALRNIP